MVRTSASASQYKRSSSTKRTTRKQSLPREPSSSPKKYTSSSSRKINDKTRSSSNTKSENEYLVNEVVAFEEFGEAQEVLKLFEFKDKVRTSEQLKRNVVIKIEASTVSLMDVLIRSDLWATSVTTPYKTGCDLVGRVINRGDDADENVQIGDMVCALGLSIGGNAKYAIISSSRVFNCPEDIHSSVAACLLRNYMAAYQCLHRIGNFKIRPGHRVLILGGAGAFGQACIQLAIAAGADEIYATGESDKSKIIIESLGAQSLGRSPNKWLPEVKGRMDIVIDSVCSDRFRSSHRALSKRGKLVCVGSTSPLLNGGSGGGSVHSGVPLAVAMDMKKATSLMTNTYVYDVFKYFESKRDFYKKDLLRLFHLCRIHEISPKVAYCVPLNEVANAHDDLQFGEVADGSIVCVPFGVSPDVVEVNQHEEEKDVFTTEYSDGVKMRLHIDAGALETRVGKVQRDGSFKVSKVKPPPDRTSLRSILDDRDDTESEVDREYESTRKKSSSPRRKQMRDDNDPNRKSNSEKGGRGRHQQQYNDESSDNERPDQRSTKKKKPGNRHTDVASVASSYVTEQTEDQSISRGSTPVPGMRGRGDQSVGTYDQSVGTFDQSAATYDQSVVTEGEESEVVNPSRRKKNNFVDTDSYAEQQSYTDPKPRHSSNKRGGPNPARGRNSSSHVEDSYHDGRQQPSRMNNYPPVKGYGQPPKPSKRDMVTLSQRHVRDDSTFRHSSRNPQPQARSKFSPRDEPQLRQPSRARSSSRAAEKNRARSKSRGRVEAPRARSKSRGRGEAPRARSKSRGRGEAPRARSKSRGRGEAPKERSRSRTRKGGPRARSRSRSKSRARSKSRTRKPVAKGKGIFAKLRNMSRDRNTARPVAVRNNHKQSKLNRQERQHHRETQRRDMMYVEHDPEESSLFPEIEAVRSMVRLKGDDETGDEQSEASSYAPEEREERPSRRERSRSNVRSSSNRQSRPHNHQRETRTSTSRRQTQPSRSNSRRR